MSNTVKREPSPQGVASSTPGLPSSGLARCRISALGPHLFSGAVGNRTCVPGLGTHPFLRGDKPERGKLCTLRGVCTVGASWQSHRGCPTGTQNE